MAETTKAVLENTDNNQSNPVLDEMARAGILYGRSKSRSNPKMSGFVQAARNGVNILDLASTLKALEKAEKFIKETVEKGGLLLLVGTHPAAKEAVKAMAVKFGYPFVVNRWLGGTLTNFKTLSTRINRFIKLKEDRTAGRLDKYTKKERLIIDREINRMEHLFGGLEKMSQLPTIVVITDTKVHDTAVREAIRMKIPVVGIMNTDSDPANAQYPIPANTSAKSSMDWILNRLAGAIEDGRKTITSVKSS